MRGEERTYIVTVTDDQGVVIYTEEVYLIDNGELANIYGSKPKMGRIAIMAASDAVYFND